MAEVGAKVRTEVLLSFWGELFMARTIERSVLDISFGYRAIRNLSVG